MTQEDENGEHHPVVPPPFGRCIFLVLVQNNETHEVYTAQLKAFKREGDAQDYANTFGQHWITARILLLPIVS